MSQPGPGTHSEPAEPTPAASGVLGRLGTDWWATIVAGVITLLAVTNLLPKIPW